MEHITYTQMEKLKEAKTVKELKEALVKMFEELEREIENTAYTTVNEALKNKEEAKESEEYGTSVRP